MKKHLLIPFVALLLLAAGSVSAQDKAKSDDKDSYIQGHYKGDYHCYRAWRKDEKIKKKQWQAEEMEHFRPWAAERKMRSAYRKAWRRDMLEHGHRTGYAHGWWAWLGDGDYWY